jgi:transposase
LTEQKVKHRTLRGERLNDAKNKPSKRRTYTREFKLKVLGEIEAGKSQAQAARDYQLTEIAIDKWRQQLKKYKEHAFAGQGKAYTDEARLHGLERMVGLNPDPRRCGNPGALCRA